MAFWLLCHSGASPQSGGMTGRFSFSSKTRGLASVQRQEAWLLFKDKAWTRTGGGQPLADDPQLATGALATAPTTNNHQLWPLINNQPTTNSQPTTNNQQPNNNQQPTTNNQHTTHNTQHTTHNTQTTHNTTQRNTQHAAHNTQHTTHNTQHTTRNTQHT